MSKEEIESLYSKKALKTAKRILGEFGYRVQGDGFDNTIKILDANNNCLEKGHNGFTNSNIRIHLNGSRGVGYGDKGILIFIEDNSGLCFRYEERTILSKDSMDPDEFYVAFESDNDVKPIKISFKVNYANPRPSLYKGDIGIVIYIDGAIYDYYEIYCRYNRIECYRHDEGEPIIGKNVNMIKSIFLDMIDKEYPDNEKLKFFILNLLKEYEKVFDRLNEHFRTYKEYYIASLEREAVDCDKEIAKIEKKKEKILARKAKLLTCGK